MEVLDMHFSRRFVGVIVALLMIIASIPTISFADVADAPATTDTSASQSQSVESTDTGAISDETAGDESSTTTQTPSKARAGNTPGQSSAVAAATDLVYNGQSQTLVTGGSSSTTYSLTRNGRFTSTKPSGTDAGEYTVYYKSGNNSSGGAGIGGGNTTQSVTVTIAKASVTTPSSVASKVYNGETQTADTAAIPLNYKGDDDMYTITNNGGKNVGSYNVVYSLTSKTNYKWSTTDSSNDITDTFTITKAEIAAPTSVASKVYNGETQTADIDQIPNNYEGVPAYTVTNEGGTDVGTYDVVYSLTDKDNYKWSTGDSEDITLTFSITQKEVATPQVNDKVYTGELITASISSSLYTAYKDEGGTNIGDYAVTLQLNDSKNYKWANPDADDPALTTVSYKITQATNKWVAEPTISDWVYGSTANTPDFAAKFGTESAVIQYKGVNEPDSAYTKQAPTNAGEYVVKVTIPGDENYTELTSEPVTFTIAPKPITDASIVLGGGPLVYNGTLQTVAIASVTLDGQNVTYNVDGNQAENAGNYTLTITGTGNYTGTATADYTIEKAVLTIATVAASKGYGEEEPDYELSVTGLAANDAMLSLVSREDGETVGEYNFNVEVKNINRNDLTNWDFHSTKDNYEISVDYTNKFTITKNSGVTIDTTVTDEDGNKITTKVNDENFTTEKIIKYADGNTTVIKYSTDGTFTSVTTDAAGNTIQTIDADGNVTDITYNEDGSIVKETTNADGKLVQKIEIDADGNVTTTDYDLTNEDIDRVVTIVSATGETTKLTYTPNGSYIMENYDPTLIEGDRSTYNGGSALTFHSDDAIVNFLKVLVDGQEVSEDNYILSEGSIIVELSKDYLDTLAVGTHDIAIVSTNGEATGTFNVAKQTLTGSADNGSVSQKAEISNTSTSKATDGTAKTGDSLDVALPMMALLLSLVGAAWCCRRKDVDC
jgi:YD repeat-containing protein